MQDSSRPQDWTLAPETEYRFCGDLVLAFHAGTGDTLVLAGAGAQLLTTLAEQPAAVDGTLSPDWQEAVDTLHRAGLIQPVGR